MLADRVAMQPRLAPEQPTDAFVDDVPVGQAIDIAVRTSDSGEPRIPLVHQLRERVGDGSTAFLWVSVLDPSESELQALEAEFDLPPLLVETAGSIHQRARIQSAGEMIFALLKSLSYVEETSDVETGQVSFFVNQSFVISVRFGATLAQAEIREKLAEHSELMQYGTVAIFYTVMDWIADGYTHTSDEVAADIEDIEAKVFSPSREDQSSAIYRLKRENLEVRRAVTPLLGPALEIIHDDTGPNTLGLTEETEPLFRDVAEHLLRAAERTESNDQLLMTMLTAARSQQDLQQNEDMRKISAWVAIAAVPTMVAGIYGMNFEHMPELRWEYGYFVVLGLIAIVCFSLYRAFKRSGWL